MKPTVMYGYSGCKPPTLIKIRKLATNTQKDTFIIGLNAIPRKVDLSKAGKSNKTRSAENIAKTPNPLDGIERKIA